MTHDSGSNFEQSMESVKFFIVPYDATKSNWKTYLKRLKNKFSLHDVQEDKMVLILLDVIGEQMYERLTDLCEPDEPEKKTFNELEKILTDFFDPEPNILVERVRFQNRFQLEEESCKNFAAELKKLTRFCKFPADWFSDALCTQFVNGIKVHDLRLKLLEKKNLTFEKALEYACSYEINQLSAKNFGRYYNNQETNVNKVTQVKNKTNENKKKCKHCGYTNHMETDCRFKYAICHKCGTKGHISPICKDTNKFRLDNRQDGKNNSGKSSCNFVQPELVNNETNSNCEEEEITNNLYTTWQVQQSNKLRKNINVNLYLDNIPVNFQIDTGASVTLIGLHTFKKYLHFKNLIPSFLKLHTYTGERVHLAGKCQIDVKVKPGSDVSILTLYVVNGSYANILGLEWLRCIKLDWVKIFSDNNNVNSLQALNTRNDKLEQLKQKYSKVFKTGIGKIKDYKARIFLKPESCPIFKKHRNVAYALIPKVEAEIERLEREGIISKVHHSEYATPVVPIVKKDGSIRLCGDYKVTINPQILVEEHPIPNIEQILANIGNSKFYSKLDISQAYNHIEIDEQDRHLLTINTIKGLFHYNRLPFGITSAPAIWQRAIEEVLQGISGVQVFFDDICISSETENEHLDILEKVFNRFDLYNIRLNVSKCQFLQNSIEYCGYVISSDGLKKCSDKVKAVLNAKEPKNVTEVKSFLGMVNFYGRFVNGLSTMAYPLYLLLRSNIPFQFNSKCRIAFNAIKRAIASDYVLVHFDPNKKLILSTDASNTGLGAVLSHRFDDGTERPIAFASRTLNKSEIKYSAIDKEALAIIFGIKKFFQYLYGNQFTLITDSKPLVSIFNPSKELPALSAMRMQRYAIYLQSFRYKIEYRNTNDHGNADCLSRLPLIESNDFELDETDIFTIHQITTVLPITAIDIERETRKDKSIFKLYQAIMNGVTIKRSETFGHPQENFSVAHGCLFLGHRVYIPGNYRRDVLKELHTGHQGMVKMKSLARSYVWWPKIDENIEDLVSNCEHCQKFKKMPIKAPIHKWEYPRAAMERVHIDYAGPFKGYYYLIIVDAFSKWVDVIPVKKITSSVTIEQLSIFFVNFGLPYILVSDNGTQFKSEEFTNFCKINGIIQRFSAPFHPATNGLAERNVQTFKKSLRASLNNNNNMMEGLRNFLVTYRKTPHSITGRSPSSLFLGRELRSKLDLLKPNMVFEQLKKNDVNKNIVRNFKVGDPVAIRMYNDPNEYWKFGTIEAREGELHYCVNVNGSIHRRHVDQIRNTGKYLVQKNDSSKPVTPIITFTQRNSMSNTSNIPSNSNQSSLNFDLPAASSFPIPEHTSPTVNPEEKLNLSPESPKSRYGRHIRKPSRLMY